MFEPLEPLGFPSSGELRDEDIFVLVGAVMNQWERAEFELSRTYSLFAGDPEWLKTRDYGNGNIFRERLTILRREAERYFFAHHDQRVEGDFDAITARAEALAVLRNEIAHGVVMNVERSSFFKGKMPDADLSRPHILLIPPYHLTRKHDALGLPSYAYSAAELIFVGTKIAALEQAADAFNRRTWPVELRGTD